MSIKEHRLRRYPGIFAGVCAGLGEFFGISAFWFRLLLAHGSHSCSHPRLGVVHRLIIAVGCLSSFTMAFAYVAKQNDDYDSEVLNTVVQCEKRLQLQHYPARKGRQEN